MLLFHRVVHCLYNAVGRVLAKTLHYTNLLTMGSCGSRTPIGQPPASAYTSTRKYVSPLHSEDEADSEAEISHSPARQTLNLKIRMMDRPGQTLVPFVVFSGSKEWMLHAAVSELLEGKVESPGVLPSKSLHRRIFTRVELDKNDKRIRRKRVVLQFFGDVVEEDGDRTLDALGIMNGSVVERHVV